MSLKAHILKEAAPDGGPPVGSTAVGSPAVGHWWPSVPVGAALHKGMLIGHIERLGRRIPVLAPDGQGQVLTLSAPGPLQYGSPLLTLGQLDEQVQREQAQDLGSTQGLIAIRAPMAGTVYLAPSPAAAPFAAVGQPVERMARIALIEVMKTFTPITSTTSGVLERVDVADGDAVESGAAVAWIRAE